MIKSEFLQEKTEHKFKQLDPSLYSLDTGFADIMLILIIHGKFELAEYLYFWSRETKSTAGLIEKTLQIAALSICNMINEGTIKGVKDYFEFFRNKPEVDETFFLQRISKEKSLYRKIINKEHNRIKYNPNLKTRINEAELLNTDEYHQTAYLNRLVHCLDPFKQAADIIVMLFEGSPIYLKKLRETSVKIDKIRTVGFEITDKNKFNEGISFEVLNTLATAYIILADDDSLSSFTKFLAQKTEELKGPISTILLQVKGSLLQRFISIGDIKASTELVESFKELVIETAVNYFKVNKESIPEDKIDALVYIADKIKESREINQENIGDALVFINRYYFLIADIQKALAISCAARKLSPENAFRDNDNWFYTIGNLDDHEKESILTTLTSYLPIEHIRDDLVQWFMQGYQIKKLADAEDFNNYETMKNSLDIATKSYIKLNQSINKVFFTNKLYFYANSQQIDKVIELLPDLVSANIPNTQKNDLMIEVLHLATLNSEQDLNSFALAIESVDMSYIRGAHHLMILSNFYAKLAIYDSDKTEYYFNQTFVALRLANQKFIINELKYKSYKESIVLSNALIASIGLEFHQPRDAIEEFIDFFKKYSKDTRIKELTFIDYFNSAEKQGEQTQSNLDEQSELLTERVDHSEPEHKEIKHTQTEEALKTDYDAQARNKHQYHQERKELQRKLSALIKGNILKIKTESWQNDSNIFYSTDKNIKQISHPNFKCYVTLDPDAQDDQRQFALNHGYAKGNGPGVKHVKGISYLKRTDREGKDERIAADLILINQDGSKLVILGNITTHKGIKNLIQDKYTPRTKLSLGLISELEDISLKLEDSELKDRYSYDCEESDSECETETDVLGQGNLDQNL